MQISVVCVGKIKDRQLRVLLDDYAKRIGHYTKWREIEVRDGKAEVVAAELRKATPARATTLALEVEGKAWSSHELSQYLGRCQNASVSSLVFYIGGAYGLPKEISSSAHLQISLSRMTLPHRLARLVLFEQIYRAFTILNNEPYSH